MEILKIGPYFETRARRAKISLFLTPWGRKIVCVQLREQPLSFSLLCQNWHADLEFARKFLFSSLFCSLTLSTRYLRIDLSKRFQTLSRVVKAHECKNSILILVIIAIN